MIHIEAGYPATNLPTFLVENLLETATVIVTGGGDASLATNGATFDFWSPTAVNADAEFTFSGALPFDCLCIAAHDLGSKGATVTVRAGGADVATFAPPDDSAVMMLFPEVTEQTVEIAIAGGAAASSVGVLMLGRAISFQRGLLDGYVPTEWAQRSEILGGLTLSGQFLPQRIIRTSGETDIDLAVLDDAWWRANGDAVRARFNAGQPFFYAGGPSLFPGDIAYCWRGPGAAELRPKMRLGGFVSVAMTVSFYA